MSHADHPASQGNADQVTYWNDKAGATWTALQERLDALFAPLTQAAMAAAAPRPGEHAIDIGCGCGATVLELARHAGPGGHVLGIDVSEPMAARARARIAEAGLGNAEVAVFDAAAHAFPAGDADLLFSRFGVMFFADPVAAFANLRKAMRPGGRLLFAAWRPLADNPWFAVPLQAGGPLLPPQPPTSPDAPGPFAFADAGRVRRILGEAGWHGVGAVRQDAPMRFAGPGQIEEATEFATRVGPLARALAEAGDDVRARVREAVSQALHPYDGPDGIALPGSVWLVSAQA